MAMGHDGRAAQRVAAAPKRQRAAAVDAAAGRRGDPGGTVGAFISHAYADPDGATALREALAAAERDRAERLREAQVEGSGEDWPEKLRGALTGADWLACGYAAGVSTQGKEH